MNETTQLNLDDAIFEGSPYALSIISSAIEKRDSEIKNLKETMTKQYKVGDSYKRYDATDDLFNDLNPLYLDAVDKYSKMKAKCDEILTQYNDMKAKCDETFSQYNDMKAKCDEIKKKYDEMNDKFSQMEKKDSLQIAEIEKLSGENLILKNEIGKRSDSEEIARKVNERCTLIAEVSKMLRLDSDTLFPMSNKEIKIKAIQSLCDFPVEKTMEDTFIDGAYTMAKGIKRTDFAMEVKKIENIKTEINKDKSNPFVEDLQRRIAILNKGVI